MTAYRLFPSTDGPSDTADPTYGSQAFLSGVAFEVTAGGIWFEGYWWWVCASGGQPTTATKFALWSMTATGVGTVIPAATVTSGTLTAGQWNYVPLSSPVQLAIGQVYMAAVGVNGPWPETSGSFGSGDTYSAGIVNGPLSAFSDQSGTLPVPWDGQSQGTFTAQGDSDPSQEMPTGGDSSANFWVDVQVSDTAPAGYSGSYRLWPNNWGANQSTSSDASVNYVIATEIHLSQSCTLDNVWYYSPSGTDQLATRAGVYSITGADAGTEVAAITSPSWSGDAASGWVSAAIAAGTTLPAGHYKVYVYNDNESPDGWSSKDDSTDYWGAGAGGSGITWGPLYAPPLAGASLAYEYDSGGGSNTPPYSNGDGTTLAGQATFAMSGGESGDAQYPYLYATGPDGQSQNYWVDLEVTPVASPSPSGTGLLPDRDYDRPSRLVRKRFLWLGCRKAGIRRRRGAGRPRCRGGRDGAAAASSPSGVPRSASTRPG